MRPGLGLAITSSSSISGGGYWLLMAYTFQWWWLLVTLALIFQTHVPINHVRGNADRCLLEVIENR